MKVTIFGTGYVGLVTGACLSEVGHHVMCIDVDEQKIEGLKNGIMPIYEPGLDSIVKENYESGRLLFSTNIKEAVGFANIQFIAVGTPPDEDGSADLQYVISVVNSIGEYMNGDQIVINKSTVPVGTGDKVAAALTEKLSDRDSKHQFNLVSNPEFLKEGSAVGDFMKPDRIIIGTDNIEVEKIIRELYAPFNRNHERIIFMDVRSAELTKYAANSLLATKISFMNEMSNLAERLGADIENVRLGIGSDPRIGYQFIYPGCGYGGSCFPKDLQALARSASEEGYNAELLNAVESVNYRQKEVLFDKITRHYNGKENLKGKTIALWGLAFKPNTDDMREAPSRTLMESLWNAGASVNAYDPESMEESQRIYGNRSDLNLMGTKEACLQNADMLLICTEWKQFRAPDFDEIKKSISEAVIFDGRNLYDPQTMKEKGFAYYAIGRGDSIKKFN
ncbi:MAG: UDP-glucose/GDP-mannose dehydrogenase family protein [Thiohalomonas sp.]|nr:UDP-glucose/GDP-mannose dehydrogenase family protein [Thiohalomonas sp.]